MAALALTGCSDDGNDKSDSKPSASPTRDENGLSLVDCSKLPDENAAGPYEADEVGWADEQADLVKTGLDADEVRYCIDSSGVTQYFAILDAKYDKASVKDDCKSGTITLLDRPGAIHIVYADQTVACADE